MLPISPDRHTITDSGVLHWAQSVYRALNKALSLGEPIGQNAALVYNQFTQDNTNGVLIRIGAAGGTEVYNWPAPNVGIAINHGLQRQPIGFITCDIDAGGIIYRTVSPPTADTIVLACTSGVANATVYIF